MENYKLDSHKLMFHPEHVFKWINGIDIYPIYCEVSISGICNHRCTFCGVDYMGYNRSMISKDILIRNLEIMYSKGLKSTVFAGNGEPLLHKDAVEIITATKRIGIDVALSTNGVLFDADKSTECLPSLTWIRFSTSAANEETYQKIHQGKPGDLKKVFDNIYNASEIKKRNNLKTTIGVQLVLIEENINDVIELAYKCKELGADYYTVKSFGFQPLTKNQLKDTIYNKEFYDNLKYLEEELSNIEDTNFKVYFRTNRMSKVNIKKTYNVCHAIPFTTYIDSDGDVWPCCVLVGTKDLQFGSIYEKNFDDIWESPRKKEVIERLHANHFANCPTDCRLDEMNRYLHEIRNPNLHVNFI